MVYFAINWNEKKVINESLKEKKIANLSEDLKVWVYMSSFKVKWERGTVQTFISVTRPHLSIITYIWLPPLIRLLPLLSPSALWKLQSKYRQKSRHR